MDRENVNGSDLQKRDTTESLRKAAPLISEGKIVPTEHAVALLEASIKSGDRVTIEGNNQKQADFLAECLCKVDPENTFLGCKNMPYLASFSSDLYRIIDQVTDGNYLTISQNCLDIHKENLI